MKLSVLMSVYGKESPAFLRQSLDSLVAQTLPADEVVIVLDGPVGEELQMALSSYTGRLPIVSLNLPVNVGLGKALHAGLNICRGDYVARMDSDDLCLPDRFRLQMLLLEANSQVDVIGGAIAEFDSDPSAPHSIRILPASGSALLRFAHYRNPMNHMTVMFRRASVLAAGNYQHCLDFEDYFLWARMLTLGYQLQNTDRVLVYARSGHRMQARRGGPAYFKHEIALQILLRRIGFLTPYESLRNILLRAPARLAPVFVRSFCYRVYLRNRFVPDSRTTEGMGLI